MVVWGCLSFDRFFKKYVLAILFGKRSHSMSFEWSVEQVSVNIPYLILRQFFLKVRKKRLQKYAKIQSLAKVFLL